jgi:hypothetical protein
MARRLLARDIFRCPVITGAAERSDRNGIFGTASPVTTPPLSLNFVILGHWAEDDALWRKFGKGHRIRPGSFTLR